MMSRRQFLGAAAATPVCALLNGAQPPGPELLWAPPVEPSLILKKGVGGVDRTPRGPFAFIEEDRGGTNPKLKVQDASGVEWNVKWAEEIHSETFASRLAAAVGYFVRPTYYVPSGRITGCEGLTRAKTRVQADGSFETAVFKLIPDDEPYLAGHNWTWFRNPFLGTADGLRQLNGLKIMIMLTSNWDAKDTRNAEVGPNTAIYEVRRAEGVEYHYAFDDWGGSMGRWGSILGRSKWDAPGYSEQSNDFVRGMGDDGFIEWGFTGKNGKDVRSDISAGDATWLLQTLDHVKDEDLSAALVAAGATGAEAAMFTEAILRRIRRLHEIVS
jgi:hypothetical protein